jgi:hypothetical protein
MRNAWGPQQPVENLCKQVQEFLDCPEAGGVTIGAAQWISVVYTNIFVTYSFMSACHPWNEKEAIDKTWINFEAHFTAAYHQHKQMKGESASTYGYHSANAAVAQNED